MDNKTLTQMLKLAVNPNATVAQLSAACDYIMADIAESNRQRAINPPPPMPTDEERLTEARRRASANLAKLRRR